MESSQRKLQILVGIGTAILVLLIYSRLFGPGGVQQVYSASAGASAGALAMRLLIEFADVLAALGALVIFGVGELRSKILDLLFGKLDESDDSLEFEPEAEPEPEPEPKIEPKSQPRRGRGGR